MNSLGADGAVPEFREASLFSGRGCSSAAICLCGSEEGSEAAEDAGAGAERHAGGAFLLLCSVGVGLSGEKDGRRRLSVSCEVAQVVAIPGSTFKAGNMVSGSDWLSG